MRILAIDASTRRAQVALLEGDHAFQAWVNDDPKEHAERLIELVERALSSAGFTKSSIDGVACGKGPGSFTGIRVGMATAKGIAASLDRPLLGVGTLLAMAAALPPGERLAGQRVAAVLDAKKGEAFVGTYDHELAAIGPLVHRPLASIRALLSEVAAPDRLVVLGELAGSLDLQPYTVFRSAATDLPSAAAIGRLAWARWQHHAHDEIDDLEPVYVRAPDARPMHVSEPSTPT